MVRGYAARMATRVAHPRLTAETFDALVARNGDRFDAELIRGEVVVTPPDDPVGSSTVLELLGRIFVWQRARDDGSLLLPDVFVKLPPDTTVGPDLAWWSASRRPPIVRGPIRVVPDWVAEVLSPSTRENDLGPKREDYLAAGVRELWLGDPADRSITWVAADGREQRAGSRCTSTVLDGFSVETDALFLD